jgi:hypothetical protein
MTGPRTAAIEALEARRAEPDVSERERLAFQRNWLLGGLDKFRLPSGRAICARPPKPVDMVLSGFLPPELVEKLTAGSLNVDNLSDEDTRLLLIYRRAAAAKAIFRALDEASGQWIRVRVTPDDLETMDPEDVNTLEEYALIADKKTRAAFLDALEAAGSTVTAALDIPALQPAASVADGDPA